MKLSIIYAFLTCGIYATIATITTHRSYYSRESGDILDVRDPWHGEDLLSFSTRVVWDKEGSEDHHGQELGPRYLDSSYELSDREFEEIETRQVAQVVKLAFKGIMKVIEAITKQIQADKDV